MVDGQPIDGAARPTLKSVALPTEHGGWSLTLEPVLLGLLVAPSTAGLALGAAALMAFLVRTPLKMAMVDRWRGRHLDRTRLAVKLAWIEGLVLVGLVGVAAVTAEHQFWWPFVVAAPLIAVETWYDMRSRSRQLIPELAGAVGVGSVAAAIVLAGGEGSDVAVGVWLVIGARSIATVPFIRVQLLRAKQMDHRVWYSDLAQVVAVAIVVLGWWGGIVPPAAVAAIGVLTLFEAVTVRMPPRPAPVLGAQQVVLGLTVVLTAGLGFLFY